MQFAVTVENFLEFYVAQVTLATVSMLPGNIDMITMSSIQVTMILYTWYNTSEHAIRSHGKELLELDVAQLALLTVSILDIVT